MAIFAGLVMLAGLLAYLPGLPGPLLFDDKPALTANPLVQIDGASFDEWRVAAFSSRSGPLRRPVAMLTFAANHAAAGSFAPLYLKAVNLAIHMAIAALLYVFFRAVLRQLAIAPDDATRRLIALTAAAIWLLHPLNVSTVLYAVQRMAQLSTLYVVLGLIVYMVYRQRWARQGAGAGELLAAALWLLLLTALAALSKENGALLPWLLVVLEVCIFRGEWAARPVRWLRIAGWVGLLLPVVAVLAILLASPDSLLAGYVRREFTLEERLLTQARLLWRYLGWIALPDIRAMGFQHDDIRLSRALLEPVTTAVALAGWLLALGVALALRRRYPLLLLGLLFYLVGHSMESSVLPLEMVYEHRNYLPSILIILALAVALVLPARQSRRVAIRYPVAGVLVVLCALLFVRVQTWSDELSLAHADAVNHPESARSNYFYARALLRRYERRAELGLSEQEAGDTLLLSRHYYERMYQADRRQVGSLVMLYYLDSLFFQELGQQGNWLDELEALLLNKTLQASDWNALNALVDCLESGICDAGRERVLVLLDRLAARYPTSGYVLRQRYRYLAATGAAPGELLPIVQQAQAIAPAASWVYPYILAEQARAGRVADMYESALLWMSNDPRRYSLLSLKSMFVAPERAGVATDE